MQGLETELIVRLLAVSFYYRRILGQGRCR